MSAMEFLLQQKAQAMGLPPELANIAALRHNAQQMGVDINSIGKRQTREELLASHERQMVDQRARFSG